MHIISMQRAWSSHHTIRLRFQFRPDFKNLNLVHPYFQDTLEISVFIYVACPKVNQVTLASVSSDFIIIYFFIFLPSVDMFPREFKN